MKLTKNKGLNLKVRFKNPVFIVQVVLSIFMPMLVYAGLTAQDVTSWGLLGQVVVDSVQNPYVLGTIAYSLWNALNDPTVKGIADSDRAMNYDKPA